MSKLEGFEHKGITVLVGSYGREKMALFTKNGQYLIRDTKEEMIKAIDISLATREVADKKSIMNQKPEQIEGRDILQRAVDQSARKRAAAESTKPVKFAVKAFAQTKDGRVLDSVVMMPPSYNREDAEAFMEWLTNSVTLKNRLSHHFYSSYGSCDQVAFLIVESTL